MVNLKDNPERHPRRCGGRHRGRRRHRLPERHPRCGEAEG